MSVKFLREKKKKMVSRWVGERVEMMKEKKRRMKRRVGGWIEKGRRRRD